jgi:hypothetical protein
MADSDHEEKFVCKICNKSLSTRTSLSHFTNHHRIHNKMIHTHDSRFMETVGDYDLAYLSYTEVFIRNNKKKKCVTFCFAV